MKKKFLPQEAVPGGDAYAQALRRAGGAIAEAWGATLLAPRVAALCAAHQLTACSGDDSGDGSGAGSAGTSSCLRQAVGIYLSQTGTVHSASPRVAAICATHQPATRSGDGSAGNIVALFTIS